MNDICDIIKMLATEAVESGKPVAVVTGTVVNKYDLTIETEQKLQLTEDFLIISRRFKNQDWELEDRVLLIRCDGGQKYVILDIL